MIAHPLWTKEEDNQMRALAVLGTSAAAIAERLNRSKAAVHKRARGLGLTLKWVTGEEVSARRPLLIFRFDNSLPGRLGASSPKDRA
jgi:hypothetical protein